jgi:hypothetical protein
MLHARYVSQFWTVFHLLPYRFIDLPQKADAEHRLFAEGTGFENTPIHALKHPGRGRGVLSCPA